MTLDRVKTYGRLALRLLGLLAVIGGVLAFGLLGWQWQTTVEMDAIAVSGARHAPVDTVRHLARVDSGVVMERINTAMIEDRVARHPWVKAAEVTKQRARRVLHIAVTERTPAALAVRSNGDPAYYLDRDGYAMPLPDSTGYDVPLVRGLAADYHPVRRVAPSRLEAVLAALPTSDARPLVTELTVRPDSSVGLVTAPIAGHGPIPVRLGNGKVPAKLQRLRAFAEQVLSQPRAASDSAIAEIDLRFDGQIVTRTSPLDG